METRHTALTNSIVAFPMLSNFKAAVLGTGVPGAVQLAGVFLLLAAGHGAQVCVAASVLPSR